MKNRDSDKPEDTRHDNTIGKLSAVAHFRLIIPHLFLFFVQLTQGLKIVI